MLRLMADKPQLAVIDDQIGTPTWAKGLAEVCVSAALNKTVGVYHWTDEGVASWYDFALAIQELGIEKGLLKKKFQCHLFLLANTQRQRSAHTTAYWISKLREKYSLRASLHTGDSSWQICLMS